MNYLDTGVLVSALFLRDEQQAVCQSLLKPENATSTHALAETFATLTGQYRVRNDVVSEAVLSAAQMLRVETITLEDYEAVLAESRARGVQGGMIYDALHAQVARRLKVRTLYTFNITNFQHVASGLNVRRP